MVNEIAEVYRSILIKNNKSRTGNLVNSIKALPTTEDKDGYDGFIKAASYARFVEDGRRPGKFPPPPAIQSWCRIVFPDVPEIKQQQLAYLIGRKIAKFGIPAGNYLQQAIDEVFPKYQNHLDEAIKKDFYLI